jgi:hypothetical protein
VDILNPIYNPAVMKPSNEIHHIMTTMFHNIRDGVSPVIHSHLESAYVNLRGLLAIESETFQYIKRNQY